MTSTLYTYIHTYMYVIAYNIQLTTEYKEVLGQKQELLSSHTKIPEDLSFSSVCV